MQITNSIFEAKSRSLAVLGVDPSPTFGSFSLGDLVSTWLSDFLEAFYENRQSDIPTSTSIIDAIANVEMIKTMHTSSFHMINLV
jgi:hypothetical protein